MYITLAPWAFLACGQKLWLPHYCRQLVAPRFPPSRGWDESQFWQMDLWQFMIVKLLFWALALLQNNFSTSSSLNLVLLTWWHILIMPTKKGCLLIGSKVKFITFLTASAIAVPSSSTCRNVGDLVRLKYIKVHFSRGPHLCHHLLHRPRRGHLARQVRQHLGRENITIATLSRKLQGVPKNVPDGIFICCSTLTSSPLALLEQSKTVKVKGLLLCS